MCERELVKKNREWVSEHTPFLIARTGRTRFWRFFSFGFRNKQNTIRVEGVAGATGLGAGRRKYQRKMREYKISDPVWRVQPSFSGLVRPICLPPLPFISAFIWE